MAQITSDFLSKARPEVADTSFTVLKGKNYQTKILYH